MLGCEGRNIKENLFADIGNALIEELQEIS
jgi:hypothetical protein